MKKLLYLIILGAGIIGCSTEPIETEALESYDAKVKAQEVEKSMDLTEPEICFGETPEFNFNFPQDSKGNGDPKETNIHIQVWNPELDDWESFQQLDYLGGGPEEYTYEEEVLELGTHEFRAKIGSGGFNYFSTLDVLDCSDCEESFSYMENEDGTYTFTYIPEEDIENAEVIFTFAQSVVVEGYEWDWNGKSSTRKETMNLIACESYSWTLKLEGDCSGNSEESNLWTDFKVNDLSKKNDDTPNIEKICN
ncbi:MAG TPA: hypothetical protein VLO29_09020 [Salegentibacter sp.]|nr:hypothetical protein [Salegentibacter sp.]